MRRTRAIGTVGLVLGLSGCAGTHQHQHQHHQHFPVPVSGVLPQGSPALVRSDCGCRPVGVPASAVVAARPGFPPMSPAPSRTVPSVSTASRSTVSPQSLGSGAPLPPSSRPVAVPAPAGVARHYFPSYRNDHNRSVWDPVPPDLLGVRTSMAPAADDETPVALNNDSLGSLSPAPLEPGEHDPGAQSEEVAASRPAAVASADLGAYRGDLLPVSAVVAVPPNAPNASTGQLPPAGTVNLTLPGPDLAVGDPLAQPAKTLVLEQVDAADLAGRPRLQSPTEPVLASHEQDEPSTWVSELAFQEPRKPTGLALHLPSILRGDVRPAEPRRTTVVSRFVRRIRVAGRAFLDPDSVRRESGDLAKQGQGVERASTDRLGESAKR